MTRTYAEPGVYRARLLVADDSGAINGLDQDELTIRINHQPVADAGSDQFTSDNTIDFDAGASADADGEALVYRWDFGDGSPPAGGVRSTHTYANGGTYPVVLTVDDGTGLRNATAVARRLPSPSTGRPWPTPAATAKPAPATSWSSTAAARAIPKAACCATAGISATAARPTSSIRPRPTCAARSIPVTLTVEDDFGLSRQRPHRPHRWSGSTSCRSPMPVRTSSPAPAPRSPSTARRRAITTAWSTASPGTSATVPRGGGERPVHMFAKPGDYRVVLTIEGDEIGQCANTNSAEMTVKVVDAPSASIVAPSSVGVGAPARFDASASTTAKGRIVGWDWDFGDGTMAQGPDVEHSYAKPGATSRADAADRGRSCGLQRGRRPALDRRQRAAGGGCGQRPGCRHRRGASFDASGSRDEDGGIVQLRVGLRRRRDAQAGSTPATAFAAAGGTRSGLR